LRPLAAPKLRPVYDIFEPERTDAEPPPKLDAPPPLVPKPVEPPPVEPKVAVPPVLVPPKVEPVRPAPVLAPVEPKLERDDEPPPVEILPQTAWPNPALLAGVNVCPLATKSPCWYGLT